MSTSARESSRLADPFLARPVAQEPLGIWGIASGPTLVSGAAMVPYYDAVSPTTGAKWDGMLVVKTIGQNPSVNVKDVYRSFAIDDPDGEIRGHREGAYALLNNELISTTRLTKWLRQLRRLRLKYPNRVITVSIMAPFTKEAWQLMVLACKRAGADIIELNCSCPHGFAHRQMGSALGENADLLAKVLLWVKEVSGDTPIYVKLTPNVGPAGIVAMARVAFEHGCNVSMINTVAALGGINWKTGLLLPSNSGLAMSGGLSGRAVFPISTEMVRRVAEMRRRDFPHLKIAGMGGIRTGADAAFMIALGADTIQMLSVLMEKGKGPAYIEQLSTEFNLVLELNHLTPATLRDWALEKVRPQAELVSLLT